MTEDWPAWEPPSRTLYEHQQGEDWARPDAKEQRPMVTLAQYDAARAVLDALPPGFYVKCGGCGGWWQGGNFTSGGTVGPSGPRCERCQ